MTQRNYCFDIEPVWGSHAPTLATALASLPAGSLVIEHGVGMYSSPLIARQDLRVICIEEAPGWRSWAQWLYGAQATMLSRAKQCREHLAAAALVFIDGAARERGDLIRWALEVGSPLIIAHDTQDQQYGYPSRWDGYKVTSDGGNPLTTTYSARASESPANHGW